MSEKIEHTLPYGRALRCPDAFLRWVARRVVDAFGGVVGCEVVDLVQEGRLAIWRAEKQWRRKGNQFGDRGYVTYMMVFAYRRMQCHLQEMIRQRRIPPDCVRPRLSSVGPTQDFDEGGLGSTEQSMFVEEQLMLVEAVILDLWGEEQGARDYAVFTTWLRQETRTLSDVVEICDWLPDARAAQAVLERVILALREYFDGDVTAPIILGGLGNPGGSRGTRKSREDIADYQAEYYQQNREKLKARSRERMRRKRAEEAAAKKNGNEEERAEESA